MTGPAALFDVTGRTALVTGSSRGLGLAFAAGLASAGARVILHGRDLAALEQADATLTQAGQPALGQLVADLTEVDTLQEKLTEMVAEHGVPDILVNNAGIQRRAPFTEFSFADWDAIVSANLSSAFYVSRLLAPGMVERGSGKIVNVGSVQSALARRTIAPYGATKAGLVQLTRGMAADLSADGVQVNAISPGYFETEMNAALVADEEFSSWLAARTPAGRWGQVEELVGTLIYLCAPASNFVSGQNIFVDGGLTSVV